MAESVSDDTLHLGNHSSVLQLISKIGDNFPEQERVVLSAKVIKINKRRKEQERILLLTNKALYNLKPKELKKCRRRVSLEKIVSISTSTTSPEFVIHIPDEYDYCYKTRKKERIIRVLNDLYKRKEGKHMNVSKLHQDCLAPVTVTKNIARLQSREQRLQRYRELIGKDTFEDEIDDIQRNHKVSNLEGTEESKVSPNDFEFLKVIGRGSFGKVMQVQKKDTKEIFAMKILKKRALIAKGQVEHTNDERKILQSLQHPFLMKLRFAFQTEAKLYFVLDYYRGGELFFHLKRKRKFPELEGRFIVAEVGMALGYLHSLSVIYRDLKPENILLSHAGHICLTDFGLSKDLRTSAEDVTNSFCGTPEYMPPEIIRNEAHGKAVDWWGLGILLYELVVGIPPFYSQNVNEMYHKIREAPLLFPPSLSNPCKDLISRLLNRDENHRLGASGKDFAEIQRHSFFRGLDWEKLYRKELQPPYQPNVQGKDHDVPECFEQVFLNETAVDSHAVAPTYLQKGAKEMDFGGFTFQPEKGLK